MPPQENEPVIYEKEPMSPITKVVFGIVIGFIVLVCVGFILTQTTKNTDVPIPVVDNREADLQAEIARIKAEEEGKPFVFTAVPDALNKISLPPPPESNESDAAIYTKLKATTTIPEAAVQDDVVFNLAPLGISYIDYLNNLNDPSEIYQLTDELRQLTLALNEKYQRPPLAERIQGVVQMAPLDKIVAGNETPSVYPSIRAVDAFLALEIMSRIDPENAALYEAETTGVINRGIGYGLYGQSDVDAARLLVTQYMNIYTASSTTAVTDKN
jgi:hypothetical protein